GGGRAEVDRRVAAERERVRAAVGNERDARPFGDEPRRREVRHLEIAVRADWLQTGLPEFVRDVAGRLEIILCPGRAAAQAVVGEDRDVAPPAGGGGRNVLGRTRAGLRGERRSRERQDASGQAEERPRANGKTSHALYRKERLE